MPRIPIVMPQLGESIAEATVLQFLRDTGESVKADEDIIEVETQKATMAVTAPCPGVISEFSVELNESYAVGDVLGYVEASAEDVERLGLSGDSAPEASQESNGDLVGGGDGDGERRSAWKHAEVTPTVKGLPVPAHAAQASYMSPRMKARIHELGLHEADLSGIPGSGAGGRITVKDFESFLSQIEQKKTSKASSMRIAVADAMRRSWTRPLATVGLPVALDGLLSHRKVQDPRPGPTLYALRAFALALAENDAPAGQLVGNEIVHPAAIHVGFAVEAEDGVLVPVIRDADKHSLSELVSDYNRLLEQAKARKVAVADTEGSIGTVTNYGTFGLTWATPIPLPEQTLVLGLGAGRKAPCWNPETERFEPVTEALLTLSFDHRVLDGGMAGRLLARIGALMETPETL